MRIYSLYWRPVEHCGEMETFLLTAFTNTWGLYYVSKSVNCPLAPVWAGGSLLPPPHQSVLSIVSEWYLTSLTSGPGKKTDPEGSSQQDSHPPPCQHRYAILQLTRFLKKFPSTYCIPSALLEIKGPAEGSVSVQHPKGTFTARVNHIHLQQNLPTVRGLCHTGSISHTSSTTFSDWEDLIWDWAIFQQEDGKPHIISLRP